jgi:hypothetical protein
MKKVISLGIAMMCMIGVAQGQNVKEAVQNTKQIAEGKKNLERDTRELQALKTKIGLFAVAFDNSDAMGTNKLKQDIVKDMLREVGQSGEKAKKARIEVAQSGAEVRSDRREIRGNKKDSNKGRFDRKDDKKDMA